MSNRKYNRAFKIALCESVVSGQKSKAQCCRENGLTPSMFDRWVDQYRRLGSDAFPHSDGPAQIGQDRRILELEALVGRLTLENQLLKSALEKGAVAPKKEKE